MHDHPSSQHSDAAAAAETESIIIGNASESDSLPSSALSRTPTSSSVSFTALPLWYRSSPIRLVCLVSSALLVLLNLLSLLLDSQAHCPLLKVYQYISTAVYSVFLLLLAVPMLVSAAASAGRMSVAAERLLFAVLSALSCIVMGVLAVLGAVCLLVRGGCYGRVFFSFVSTLDTAVPIFACSVIVCYAALSNLGHYRQKQDEGVDLSVLSPSLADLHLLYFALAALLCTINATAAVLHTPLADYDGIALVSWIAVIVQCVLCGLLALLLLASLAYRLSVSTASQPKLLQSAVSELSQQAMVFVVVLLAVWVCAEWANSTLTLVMFVKKPGIGGLAVVGWVNQIADVVGAAAMVWEVWRHWEAVSRYGEMVWLSLKGEGMTTGIYAGKMRQHWPSRQDDTAAV